MGGFSRVRYNTGEEIFRIKIEDTHGAKIEDWVIMSRDFPKWVHMIASRFGFDVGGKSEKKKTSKDLEWAK